MDVDITCRPTTYYLMPIFHNIIAINISAQMSANSNSRIEYQTPAYIIYVRYDGRNGEVVKKTCK